MSEPEQNAHPEVVALLLAAELPDDPRAWLDEGRIDGRALNEHERHLLLCVMTLADVEVYRDLARAEADRQEEMLEANRRLLSLVMPFVDDEEAPMSEALDRMPPELRAEAERLLDVACPSGYIQVWRSP